ncbi:cuticle collagen rol-6-like, partial [Spodoptera litura]|uniref:Cuticle collagen rol-6-like n=1 Tax=Spodoptera litura TaxID=69820 RepID=A0A9J7DQ18_SPOLT
FGPSSSPQGARFPVASNDQGYPRGPAGSLSGNAPSSAVPSVNGQGSPFRPTGSANQYTPSTNSFGLPKPNSAAGPVSGSNTQGPFGSQRLSSAMTDAGYEYNRPGSQGSQAGPSQGTQGGFGPIGQNRPGVSGVQPSVGSVGQNRPGQASPQSSFGTSGQDKPGQTFGGPRQPPSFSPEEGYRY